MSVEQHSHTRLLVYVYMRPDVKIRRNENSSSIRFSPRFSFRPESNGHINAGLLSVMSLFRSDLLH